MYPRINGQVSSITSQSIIGYFFGALGTGRGPRGKGRGERRPHDRTENRTMQPNAYVKRSPFCVILSDIYPIFVYLKTQTSIFRIQEMTSHKCNRIRFQTNGRNRYHTNRFLVNIIIVWTYQNTLFCSMESLRPCR